MPARVRKPRDKALVEAAVNLGCTRIMAQLRGQRFATLEELNAAIADHLSALPTVAYDLRRFEQPRVRNEWQISPESASRESSGERQGPPSGQYSGVHKTGRFHLVVTMDQQFQAVYRRFNTLTWMIGVGFVVITSLTTVFALLA